MSLVRPALAGVLVAAAFAVEPLARPWSRWSARPPRPNKRLLFVEKAYAQPDESPPARARRKASPSSCAANWLHASVLLYEAVEQPELLGPAAAGATWPTP